MVARRSGRE
uniref:Uncharacterized protein n=1 Tax=Arundo donax TaxID=35708 RepID=A0A0A8YCP1_ARUDO